MKCSFSASLVVPLFVVGFMLSVHSARAFGRFVVVHVGRTRLSPSWTTRRQRQCVTQWMASSTTTTTDNHNNNSAAAAASSSYANKNEERYQRAKDKRRKFIGLAKAVSRPGQYAHVYEPMDENGQFQAKSGLPDLSKPFVVLGIESSCDDTGGRSFSL